MKNKDIEKTLQQLTAIVDSLVKDKVKTEVVVSKKTKRKTSTKEEIKQQQKPTVSYSEVPNILNKMKTDELISRFGILYNSKQPYSDISRDSIVKFHQDYGIKTYKIYSLSYSNKDIIINNQVKSKNPKHLNKSIEYRITEIENRIDKTENMKPTEKLSEEKLTHRLQFLQSQKEKLTKWLSDDEDI